MAFTSAIVKLLSVLEFPHRPLFPTIGDLNCDKQVDDDGGNWSTRGITPTYTR